MSKSLFLRTLFKSGEGLCIGGFKATKVIGLDGQYKDFDGSGNFFCINPLSVDCDYGYADKDYYKKDVPRRADVNIESFRSFMFEMDSIDLRSQLIILHSCKIPFTTITYSGGKSYHAILSLSESLEANYHTDEASKYYKSIWQRLRAKIDRSARDLGYKYPKGKNSFIDGSCQNPSRLSRIPFEYRSEDIVQQLVRISSCIGLDEFSELLDSCPMVYKSEMVSTKVLDSCVETSVQFWRQCPVGLKNKLRYVDWGASEGLYPEILKLTLWAIDSTGIDKDTFIEILWEKTFPKLLDCGYPDVKLTVAVNDAYNGKRRS